MPTKKKVRVRKKLGRDTGLYRDYSLHADSPEGIRELLNMMATPLEEKIVKANEWATSLLKSHGYGGDVFSLSKQQKNMDPTDRELVNVVFYGHFLLEHLKQNKLRDAVWCAIPLGAAYERAHIRPWESDAVLGRLVRRGGKKGGRGDRVSDETDREWKSIAARLKKENPRLTVNGIASIIKKMKKHSGWSISAISRHIDPKK